MNWVYLIPVIGVVALLFMGQWEVLIAVAFVAAMCLVAVKLEGLMNRKQKRPR